MPDDFPDSADFGAIRAALDETANRIAALSDEELRLFYARMGRSLPGTREWMLYELACDVDHQRRESPYGDLLCGSDIRSPEVLT